MLEIEENTPEGVAISTVTAIAAFVVLRDFRGEIVQCIRRAQPAERRLL